MAKTYDELIEENERLKDLFDYVSKNYVLKLHWSEEAGEQNAIQCIEDVERTVVNQARRIK